MKFQHQLTYSALSLLRRWIRFLPTAKRKLLSIRIASFAHHHIPLRKQQAFENIRRAFPDKPAVWQISILKRCYTFFISNFVQLLAFPEAYKKVNISVLGKKVLDKAMQRDKGILLITGHFGAWEILIAWLGYNNYPAIGVAQRQKNRGANRFFHELRELSGVKHIYRKTSLELMYEVLKLGNILGLVSDQDAKERGVYVEFFGHLASTPKGAARFFQKTGAAMVFTACHQESTNNYVIEFASVPVHRNEDVVPITQAFTTMLEEQIRQYPEQYFWFHRRWRTKMDSETQNKRSEIEN